jgi:phosphatidylethanolamine/phosphatidyl-N-methylethanolamine N-methyltransferase
MLSRVLARKNFGERFLDDARFFRTWLQQPLKIGAVTSSGPALARAMAAPLHPDQHGHILELGPGTGPVTKAILDRGFAPSSLTAVEYNDVFVTMLAQKFPGLNVIQGDAYQLGNSVCATNGQMQFDAIVSSLPLFTKPREKRIALMHDLFSRLTPGGIIIQFSYALVPPVRAEDGDWELSVSGWIKANMPPARVWTYYRPLLSDVCKPQ